MHQDPGTTRMHQGGVVPATGLAASWLGRMGYSSWWMDPHLTYKLPGGDHTQTTNLFETCDTTTVGHWATVVDRSLDKEALPDYDTKAAHVS